MKKELFILVVMAVCLVPVAEAGRADGLYISHVHRGGGKRERPDNTLETFLWCWKNGSALECDCCLTKDGVPIMYHDGDMRRTPRGIPDEWKTRKIGEFTWDELRDIDVGSYLSPKYASHRIPRLDAVLSAMVGHPKYLLFVDDKGIGPRRLAEEARKAGVLKQIYYTGCVYKRFAVWSEVAPEGKSLLWIGTRPKNRSAEERARVRSHFESKMKPVRAAGFKHLTAVSLHVYYNPGDPVDPFVLGTDYLKSLIEEFHAHGVKVCAIPFANGDKEEVYHRLWELGCDGFSTDYPSVMFKVIHDLKSEEKR